MRFLLQFSFLLFLGYVVMAQADSAIGSDSLSISISDTIEKTQIVPNKIIQKKRNQANRNNSNGTQFFIGMATFLLFGLLRFFYTRYIDALFSTLSKSALWRLSVNERLWQNQSRRLLFMLIYFLSCGFIFGQIIDWYTAGISQFMLWMSGSLVVFGMFIFKYLVLQSVALVFRFNKVAVGYFRHITVINQVLGLILLPICGILLLLPSRMRGVLIIISLLIIAIALIFKFLINIAYVRNIPKVNYMHFIVYLCTLEFIPLAVLARYAYSMLGE